MADMIATYRRKPFSECTDEELFKASERLMKRIDIIFKQLKRPRNFFFSASTLLDELNELPFIAKQLMEEIKKRKDAIANAT